MPKYMNELIFGPLQLKGEFDYTVLDVSKKGFGQAYLSDLSDLSNYVQNTPSRQDLTQLLNESVFTRVIRLNLGHANPVIGLITVRGCYEISHLSIHKSFRRQGLAKLLLYCFANYLHNCDTVENCTKNISFISTGDPDELSLFRSLNFNEIVTDDSVSDHHMIKSVSLFRKIIDTPI